VAGRHDARFIAHETSGGLGIPGSDRYVVSCAMEGWHQGPPYESCPPKNEHLHEFGPKMDDTDDCSSVLSLNETFVLNNTSFSSYIILMDDLITSAEAARILGVGSTAIKRWSNSGALTCIKTPGGHRRFSRVEIERLRQPEAQASSPRDWSDWIEVLLREGAVHLVHARLMTERARAGAWHKVAANLGELLAEIGRRWAVGALSVVEEHILSASLQRSLATVSDTVPVAPGAPRCLLAAVEGDQHTLGLSLVELCLREAGWRAEWVGAPTRTSDVIERVRAGAVEMVALSASEFCVEPAPLAAVVDQLADTCRAERVGLVLGGNGRWPEPPAYGVRFRSLSSFYQYLVDHRRPR